MTEKDKWNTSIFQRRINTEMTRKKNGSGR